MTFRLLNISDITEFKKLRLFSLQESPMAFSESYEDELDKTERDYAAEIEITGTPAEAFVLGVFSDEGELTGFVKFKRDTRTKARHKAFLSTLYIKPSFRNRGLGAALMHELFRIIEPLEGLEQIHLWVLISEYNAVDFYTKCGFEQQGAVVSRDLKIGDGYVDAVYMVKFF